jgi:antitoxin MazE
MQIAKWGNSLAVRLPKQVVEELGLKEGDDIQITPKGKKTLAIARDTTREDALKNLRKFRGWMPKDYKFDREEAHERGWRIDDPKPSKPRRSK